MHDFGLFVAQLIALIVTGRLLGIAFRRMGQPPVVGELLAGVLLGPTIMGRFAPSLEASLFPVAREQRHLLNATSGLGSLFLLWIAGLEIDLEVLRRRSREALFTGILGLVIPFATGIALAAMLGDAYRGPEADRATFIAFIGVAMSISAIPVIARILIDLNLLETAVGQVILAAAVVDDLLGWLIFGGLLASMHRPGQSAAARDAVVHAGAVFGAFFVGVIVSASGRLPSTWKRRAMELVLYVFSPIFFGAVGLKVDFLAHCDAPLIAVMLAVAFVGKVGGCTLGAWLGGFERRDALAVGFGMNARGAMEIVLALLALEAGLIREAVFTALIVVAIVTSMASGPILSALSKTCRAPDTDS